MLYTKEMHMGTFSIFVIALALSLDAFSVSVTNGIATKAAPLRLALKFGFVFGFFQFLMPIAGYMFGKELNERFFSFDSWISLLLLTCIGGKMIVESFKNTDKRSDDAPVRVMGIGTLIALGIATSIDALAMGVTFAVEHVAIIKAASIIGIVTFLLATAGTYAGSRLRFLPPRYGERLAGCVLIGIGIKIFLNKYF